MPYVEFREGDLVSLPEGDFHVAAVLRGGMGRVYILQAASAGKLSRRLAMKTVGEKWSEFPRMWEFFEREMEYWMELARTSSTHVVYPKYPFRISVAFRIAIAGKGLLDTHRPAGFHETD